MVVWCTSTGIVCSYCLLDVVDLFRGPVNIVHLQCVHAMQTVMIMLNQVVLNSLMAHFPLLQTSQQPAKSAVLP